MALYDILEYLALLVIVLVPQNYNSHKVRAYFQIKSFLDWFVLLHFVICNNFWAWVVSLNVVNKPNVTPLEKPNSYFASRCALQRAC